MRDSRRNAAIHNESCLFAKSCFVYDLYFSSGMNIEKKSLFDEINKASKDIGDILRGSLSYYYRSMVFYIVLYIARDWCYMYKDLIAKMLQNYEHLCHSNLGNVIMFFTWNPMKYCRNNSKITCYSKSDPVHTGPDPYGHHIKLTSFKTSMTLKFVIILQNFIKTYHRKSGKSRCDRKVTELNVEITRTRFRGNGVSQTLWRCMAFTGKYHQHLILIDVLVGGERGTKKNCLYISCN